MNEVVILVRMLDFSYLNFYIKKFLTVEINNSFYQLPKETTFKLWAECVPEGFVFAVKASRFITHMKKLKDPQKTLPTFFKRVRNST